MLLRQELNKLLAVTWMLLIASYSVCHADWVVTQNATAFGRIQTIDHTGVALATGCSGTRIQQFTWDQIDEYSGIEFNQAQCNATIVPTINGATEACSGPTAKWFAVKFSDESFLWAEDVNLKADGEFSAKMAKGAGNITGPGQFIRSIFRHTVCTEDIVSADFKWPRNKYSLKNVHVPARRQ